MYYYKKSQQDSQCRVSVQEIMIIIISFYLSATILFLALHYF